MPIHPEIPTMFQVQYQGKDDSYTVNREDLDERFGPYTWDEENGYVVVIEADAWPLLKRRKSLKLVEVNGTEPDLGEFNA